MPNQHANPMLGWHPPAELSAWVKTEAKRRGVPYRVLLDEALAQYRERNEQEGEEGTMSKYLTYDEAVDKLMKNGATPECAFELLDAAQKNPYCTHQTIVGRVTSYPMGTDFSAGGPVPRRNAVDLFTVKAQ